MELDHVRIQPQDIARALWDANYATEREEIDAWLEREFSIREPFAGLLEADAEVAR